MSESRGDSLGVVNGPQKGSTFAGKVRRLHQNRLPPTFSSVFALPYYFRSHYFLFVFERGINGTCGEVRDVGLEAASPHHEAA